MLVRVSAAPEQRTGVVELANLFRGRVVDVARQSLTVELSGPEAEVLPSGLVLEPKFQRPNARCLLDYLLETHEVRLVYVRAHPEFSASAAAPATTVQIFMSMGHDELHRPQPTHAATPNLST